jgi:LPXTG-motif cell wall-anchored protein
MSELARVNIGGRDPNASLPSTGLSFFTLLGIGMAAVMIGCVMVARRRPSSER